MSDKSEGTTVSLGDQIRELVQKATEESQYVTVRALSKMLNIKQTEVRDALPAGIRLEYASDGTLSSSKVVFGEPDAVTVPVGNAVDLTGIAAGIETETNEDSDEEKDPAEPKAEAEAEAEDTGPRVICAVCGNPVRKSTIVRKGVCPLCFRTLAKNAGVTSVKLEAMSDDDFNVILGNELGNRQKQVDYKTSRTLTKEQFDAFDPKLIPVKEVFAAGKVAGYGPGRVAQAMGGDRFRHEPQGGFGSVWTPYFYGPRNGWYFDPDILNHFDELKRAPKVVVEKKAKGDIKKDPTASRTGARGAKMTPVATTPMDGSEGVPADADTATMAANPA